MQNTNVFYNGGVEDETQKKHEKTHFAYICVLTACLSCKVITHMHFVIAPTIR